MYTVIIPVKENVEYQVELCELNGMNLLDRKIKTLLSCEKIGEIILSTDSEYVAQSVSKFETVKVLRRDSCIKSAGFGQLVENIAEIASHDNLIWAFATTQFKSGAILEQSINIYENLDFSIFDSLLTCIKLEKYILDDFGPLNFRTGLGHQDSQSLSNLYYIVNGYFIMSKKLNLELKYPWGNVPFKYLLENNNTFQFKSHSDFDKLKQQFESEIHD
jgi:CMP-N-acetylneuraminic acid synthetase